MEYVINEYKIQFVKNEKILENDKELCDLLDKEGIYFHYTPAITVGYQYYVMCGFPEITKDLVNVVCDRLDKMGFHRVNGEFSLTPECPPSADLRSLLKEWSCERNKPGWISELRIDQDILGVYVETVYYYQGHVFMRDGYCGLDFPVVSLDWDVQEELVNVVEKKIKESL